MSFLDTIERAKSYLERQGRVSLRALKREFELDDDMLEELIEELVDVQAVASSDGRILHWSGEVARPAEAAAAAPAAPPSPAVERSPADYTPKHLADKILKGKSALEGERKQVTVLFADVRGSMELAGQLDPEEWHVVLDGFLQILADGVHRFEGTVNQYTGDGIMALFGAPIAHEDHAQRACYAALHIRDQLRIYTEELKRTRGLGFAARVGLNSGEVIVGKIGDDLRMDYTAQGHTVGLAARMEQLADPGAVYLSKHTAGLVEGFFDLRDLGEFEVKGVDGTTRAFELQRQGRLRTRLDVSRSRGFSRFVGRARELQTLETALEQAMDGRGQVIGVVGDAGVGKSRLCAEFVERCRVKDIPVHEAHCLSHGKTLPFLPVLELLRELFDITEQDGDRDARRKVAGELALLGPRFQDELPLVLDFLGVADPEQAAPLVEPEARVRRLQSFARAFIQVRSEPSVLLIDDLHWIDSGSDAFVAQIVEAVRETRTMLLVNFRPEYRAEWTGRSNYQQLPLTPLGAEAIAELLTELLGRDASVLALHEVIRTRSGGSPFFIEEIVQSLVEAGSLSGHRGAYRFVGNLGDLAIPATVESVLVARIDRLTESEKQVLQSASVIGKTFMEAEIKSVVSLDEDTLSDALDKLVEAELIHEHALYPEREFAFKHPLTQEVAYRSQLSDRRAETHRAVARHLAGLPDDKRDEQAALVASHWVEAGETENAVEWQRRAAQWATMRAPADAARHWRMLRELTADLPDTEKNREWANIARLQVLHDGWRQGEVSVQEAEKLFIEGREAAQSDGRTDFVALLTLAYGNVIGMAGRIDEWLRYANEAHALVRDIGSSDLEVMTLTGLVPAADACGDSRTLELLERGIELTGRDPSVGRAGLFFSPYLFFRTFRGRRLAYGARFEESANDILEVLRTVDSHDDAVARMSANTNYIQCKFLSGNYAGALAYGRAAVETADRVGRTFEIAAQTWHGKAAVLEEEWDMAVEILEDCRRRAAEDTSGYRFSDSYLLSHLARAYAGRGDADARSAGEQAVSVARESGAVGFETEAQTAFARALLAIGSVDDAPLIESALARAEECATKAGWLAYLPMVAEERGRLARLRGDEAATDRAMREAHRVYSESGATGHAARLARELGV